MSLTYAYNNRRPTYRVAVVVSKRVDKSAVVRNRIRRRVYAAARENLAKLAEPYDLIFHIYNASAATIAADELSSLVGKLTAQIPAKTGRAANRSHIIDGKET